MKEIHVVTLALFASCAPFASGCFFGPLPCTDSTSCPNDQHCNEGEKVCESGAAAPEDPGVLARDAFERTNTHTWGDADVGGTWSCQTGGSPNASTTVDGHVGRLNAVGDPAFCTILQDVADVDIAILVDPDLDPTLAADNNPSIAARFDNTGAGAAYVLLLTPQERGIGVDLLRGTGNGSLTSTALFQASGPWQARFRVTGTGPAHLQAKVWPQKDDAGAIVPEPAAWILEIDDNGGGGSERGSVSVAAAVSAGSLATRYDNFIVRDAATISDSDLLPVP